MNPVRISDMTASRTSFEKHVPIMDIPMPDPDDAPEPDPDEAPEPLWLWKD